MKHQIPILVGTLILSALLFVAFGVANAAAKDGCTINETFPPLSVGSEDGVVYASATYGFDANCNPVLVEQIRLNHLPEWITNPEDSLKVKTVPRTILPSEERNIGTNEFSVLATNTCNAKTREEDFAGADMIWVEDHQIYSWNNSTVTLLQGSTSAHMDFSWWYLNSGPTGTGGYYNPQTAWAKGEAGFYCNGGPFCGGGPMYYITLKNEITMDYTGSCTGFGTGNGTLVPQGNVIYEVWKS